VSVMLNRRSTAQLDALSSKGLAYVTSKWLVLNETIDFLVTSHRDLLSGLNTGFVTCSVFYLLSLFIDEDKLARSYLLSTV